MALEAAWKKHRPRKLFWLSDYPAATSQLVTGLWISHLSSKEIDILYGHLQYHNSMKL